MSGLLDWLMEEQAKAWRDRHEPATAPRSPEQAARVPDSQPGAESATEGREA